MLSVAALAAIWSLYDATGIRPEYVLPVLWHESGFRADVGEARGLPYYGINQVSGARLRALGIDPADYVTWPPERQIAEVVTPYYRDLVKSYGPLRSGVRAYQANFLPATLPRARALTQILTVRGESFYDYNRSLDFLGRGAITLSDLAGVVARDASAPAVRAAIGAAYAQRPTERPRNPAYGEDFIDPRAWLLAPVALGSSLLLGASVA